MSTPTFTPDPQAQRSAELAALVHWFETITPASVVDLPKFYASNAYFKDPFNEVRGLAPMEAIFSHMFVAMHAPRFVVTGQVLQGNQAFLTWDFHFAFRSFQPQTQRLIAGTTHLVFDGDGKVAIHRDYWDVAEELYEKLPLLGGLMRWLKRRAQA
jgi:hypothetical protein